MFNLVSCGCFDTVSHDIPDNRAGIVSRERRGPSVRTIEVVILHTHKAGWQDHEALTGIRTRDLVLIIATSRPRSESRWPALICHLQMSSQQNGGLVKSCYENKTVLPVVTWTLRDTGLEDPGGNRDGAVSFALTVILNHPESCGNMASLSGSIWIISHTWRTASLATSVKHGLYRNLEINQLIRIRGSWRENWLDSKGGQMLFAKLTGGHVSGSDADLEKFHKKSDT